MTTLKGTQTEKNLLVSFAGESQARNRYTFLPAKLKKKDMNKLHPSLKKLPIKKKNMPNAFLNFWKAGI